MAITFNQLRSLEGRRVRMHFNDGLETVGRLQSVTEDFDGSEHLVYDQVESASDAREFASAEGATLYAEGESLVEIEELEENA